MVGLATALALIGDTSLNTVLSTHAAEAGIALTAVGLVLSANRFVRLLLNGPFGWLTDHWPRRWVFVPALFTGMISTAVYIFAHSLVPLLLGRLLWGISWGGLWVSGNAIILDISNEHNRGQLLGSYNAFFFAGASVGSFVGGLLTDWLGYRGMLTVAASLAGVGAGLALLLLPETSHLRQRPSPDQPTPVSPTREAHFRRRGWQASVAALLALSRFVVSGLLIPTLGLFLVRQFGPETAVGGQTIGTTTLTGLGLGISAILGTLFVPLGGWLSDKWGNRWGVTAVGLFLGSSGFGLLIIGQLWSVALGLLLTAIMSGTNQGMATALMADVARGGAGHGRYLGFLFTVGDFASAIGPIITFWLIARLPFTAVYTFAGALVGVMWLIAVGWSFQKTPK